MLKRLKLKNPDYDHHFNIQNGNLSQPFTWWYFHPDYETACQLDDLGVESCHPRLSDILRLVGSHAKLWVGDWQGTIAPMDVVPQGWTYPSGKPLESEWWSQWHLCDRTEAEAVSLLNMNSIDAWSVDSPFKSGIPFQTQRSIGEVSAINAISVMRLPGMVRKDAEWLFEWLD
jgi:hypothetical protein